MVHNLIRTNKQQKGFTIIELIIVIVLIGIIIAGSSNLLFQGFRSFVSTRDILEENRQSTVVLENMVRTLRSIRSPSNINSANSTSIAFETTDGETNTYSLNGSIIEYNNIPLADNQEELELEYYDSNGTSTSNTSLIRYITINLGSTKPTITVFPWNLRE
jgi:prepilin-type N-terminal cleavage/methylation domain-containing protein